MDADVIETLSFFAQMSSGPASENVELTVTVTAQDDEPTLEVTGFTMNEGTTQALTTDHINFDDEEFPDDATFTFTAQGETNGTLVFVGDDPGVSTGTFTHHQLTIGAVVINTENAVYTDDTPGTVTFEIEAINGTGQTVTPADLVITVDPVNDDPTLSFLPNPIEFPENEIYVLGVANFDVDDEEGDEPARYLLTSNISNEQFTLEVEGVSEPLGQGQTFTHDDLVNGRVTINATNADIAIDSSVLETIRFSVQMENGPASAPSALGIEITYANDRPMLSPGLIPVAENTDHPIVASDFGYADEEGSAVNHYVIDSIPDDARIVLALNGSPVIEGQSILASEIANGALTIDATELSINSIVMGSMTVARGVRRWPGVRHAIGVHRSRP